MKIPRRTSRPRTRTRVRTKAAAPVSPAAPPVPPAPAEAPPIPPVPSEAEVQRNAKLGELTRAILPLLNGFSGGDHELALFALGNAAGHVMAASGQPVEAMACLVRVAGHSTSRVLAMAQQAQQQAQAQAAPEPPAA